MRAFLLVSVSAIPLGTLAQEAETLDEITVTATSSEVRESRAPASVTVVTGKQIEEGVPGRVGDALNNVPGVFMRGSAYGLNKPGNSVGTITLRGVPGSSRTLFLIDGIPANSPLSGTVDYSLLPTVGLDRIEVAPGLFSALYGSNAIGGVINLITKAPTKREIYASGSIGFGDGTTGRGALSYRDAFSNGLGVALDFAYAKSSGFADDLGVQASGTPPGGAIVQPVTGAVTAPTTSGGTTYIIGDRGDRPWSTLNTSARIYYDFSNVTKVSFGAMFASSYNGYDTPNSWLRNAAGQPVYNGWVSFLDSGGVTRRANLATGTPFLNFVPAGESSFRTFARGETQFGDLKFKADINYTFVDAWFISPGATAAVTPVGGRLVFSGPGTYTPGPSHRVIGTAQGELLVNNWNTTTFGVQVQNDWFGRKVTDLAFHKDEDSKTGDVSYRTEGRSRMLSAFIQNKTDFTSRLSLYLGGRYDYWTTDGATSQAPTPVLPTRPAYSVSYPERDDAAFSPKASLVWLPHDSLTLRASIGQAFRAPDLLQMYSRSQLSLTSLTDASPNLQPERATGWELGGEWRPIDGRMRVRATFYNNRITDLIYNRTVPKAEWPADVPAGVTTYILRSNVGEARIRGMEGGVDYVINDTWSVFANGAYNDTRVTKNDAAPAMVGKQLQFSPRVIANLGGAYKNGAFSAQLSGRYVSKVYSTDLNTDRATGYPGFYDPFFTLDGKLSYEVRNGVKMSLVGVNLLNRGYFQGFLQPGRTVMFEVSARL